MIKLLVGTKGSGKTKRLVDELNQLALTDKNVVCIEPGRRLDESVKYTVRLVDISEYPVNSYGELLGFIAGISSKDYDLNELYIDSIHKVASSDDISLLTKFLADLDAFSHSRNFNVHITLSADPSSLPEEIKKYFA